MLLSSGISVLHWDIPHPLHAPDGFFSLPIAIAGYVVAAVFIAFAIRRTQGELNERMVPMMGVMAAFIFAAQMINFPVAGGTSGHLVGGALAAIILGPWAAILVMTAVVGLQALLFQDGGLVVLGVNLVMMSIVSVLAGYGTYRLVGKTIDLISPLMPPLRKGLISVLNRLRLKWLAKVIGAPSEMKARIGVGGFLSAWVSVMVAAVVAAFALASSGTSPLALALPALAAVHALIGIGEGLITVFALSFIRAARPQLLQVRQGSPVQLAEGV